MKPEKELVKEYSEVHSVENGKQAVDIYKEEFEKGKPFDLICLDIIMPEKDGQQVLKEIRAFEESRGAYCHVKVIMTSALDDRENVRKAFYGLCNNCLIKPISRDELYSALKNLELIG